jgi:hypothetical protein
MRVVYVAAHTRLHGGEVAEREDRIASAYVSMRQHASAYVSIRQLTSAQTRLHGGEVAEREDCQLRFDSPVDRGGVKGL